jgi:uncharacterized membrane-anchored protein
MSELTNPITDQKISTFLGKIKQVWRINRLRPLGQILQEVKTLCDNPYTEVSDMDHVMLEQGSDRYLVQEHRDHPDRFIQADKESEEELGKLKVVLDEQKNKKSFKDLTPEEKKAFRVANIKRAREIKIKKRAGDTSVVPPVYIPMEDIGGSTIVPTLTGEPIKEVSPVVGAKG